MAVFFAGSAVAQSVVLGRNLSVGSRDTAVTKDVTALQSFLIAGGYLSGAPTGYFGNATKKAVVAWQASVRLPVVGLVGPASRKIINGLLKSTMVTPTASAVVTRRVTVTSPNGGEDFALGKDQVIRWVAANVGRVKVEVCATTAAYGYSCKLISNDPAGIAAEKGEYVWRPAEGHPFFPSKELKIRVSAIREPGNPVTDESDGYFSVGASQAVPGLIYE